MQIDLPGQVNAIHLAANKALLPLFEAVVNAVQAIEERGDTDGLIEIGIDRGGSVFRGGTDDAQLIPDIVGFEVLDNGIGFTNRHFTSFDTSYSTLKAHLGGKGIGRLVWLKAFDRAVIDSVYEEDGEWWHRQFHFVPTIRGTEDLLLEPIAARPSEPRTSVKLINFRTSYGAAAPKGAAPIAKRLIEHCLVLYMLEAMPRVVIHDPSTSTTLDLDNIYRHEVQVSSDARRFMVGAHEFSIVDILLRASAEAENAIHFCANKREVESRKLAGVIAHAENAVKAEGMELRYAACVTGSYLDERVNQERTGFNVDRAGDLALAESDVTWDQIEDAAVKSAAEFLTPRLDEAKKRSVARVEKFIEEEEPRYRVLIEHRRHDIERISGSLGDEKLELELHKALTAWRHDVKVEAARNLREVPVDGQSFDQYERDAVKAIEQLAEVVKADLAEYVFHRRTVLDFLAKILGLIESGKFAKEDVLHGLFFPTRTTSNAVDYDAHNLWVLDERLVYHKFLASDVAFSEQGKAPVRVDGKDRPDILIYNHPIAFSPDEEATTSVVIVEFKRPQRDDYTDDENPISQVLDYVQQVRAGRARRLDGSTILSPPEGTPFYCHVIATITPKLREIAWKLSFTEAPDRQGFFHYNPNFKAYIELSDYRKILHDAIKRNKAFFDKLGLHTGVKRPS